MANKKKKIIKSSNNQTKKSRSAGWFNPDSNLLGFAHRSWMKNQGFAAENFDGRPVIGICNTASEVTPVISIDDKKISDGNVGEITSKLKNLYMDIVLGESETHLPWLTFLRKIKTECNE